eukprot:g35853.t1
MFWKNEKEIETENNLNLRVRGEMSDDEKSGAENDEPDPAVEGAMALLEAQQEAQDAHDARVQQQVEQVPDPAVDALAQEVKNIEIAIPDLAAIANEREHLEAKRALAIFRRVVYEEEINLANFEQKYAEARCQSVRAIQQTVFDLCQAPTRLYEKSLATAGVELDARDILFLKDETRNSARRALAWVSRAGLTATLDEILLPAHGRAALPVATGENGAPPAATGDGEPPAGLGENGVPPAAATAVPPAVVSQAELGLTEVLLQLAPSPKPRSAELRNLLIRAGRLAAQKFRAAHDGANPPCVQRLVENAMRPVNLYFERDRQLLVDACREVLAKAGPAEGGPGRGRPGVLAQQ